LSKRLRQIGHKGVFLLILMMVISFSELWAQNISPTRPGNENASAPLPLPPPGQSPQPGSQATIQPAPAQPGPNQPVSVPPGSVPVQPPASQPPGTVAPASPDQPRPDMPFRTRVRPGDNPAAPHRGGGGGEVSFNFDDADVFSVIQTIFGGVLRYNYIIDPKVKGRVNFRSVSPVPRADVLPLMEVILRLNGIGVIEENGLYRIIPIADMPKEPAPVKIGREPDKVSIQGLGLLQVVPMRYITSTEMVKVLTPFLSANALIVDVPKINYLVMVDTDANIKRLLKLVEIFDSEQLRQVKPQVYVYPVQNAKSKDLAALLQQIFLGSKAPARTATTTTSQPAKPGTPATPTPQPVTPTGPASQTIQGTGEALVSELTKIFPDEVTNSIIILATPEDYALILETLKKVDIVPRQVMIEVLIAEITLTDELTFGMEWALRSKGDTGFISASGTFSPTQSSSSSSTSTTSTSPAGFTFFGIDTTGLIRGYIQALSTQGKTNVLASPHIMAADNRDARIQIGSQVPIVTDVQSTTVTTQTVQYKDTGVILKITPSINDSGLVSLKISQEVSDYTFQPIGTNIFPVFTKREAETFMVALDGQTIVLGGLISESKKRSRSGIPFLSKIPVLGYLFGYTDDSAGRSEIIMLLRPRVVRNHKEAEKLTDYYIHRLDKSFKTRINLDKKDDQ
jgi:type II secretory pathway component GspD/PulD (secretin)